MNGTANQNEVSVNHFQILHFCEIERFSIDQWAMPPPRIPRVVGSSTPTITFFFSFSFIIIEFHNADNAIFGNN